MIRYEDFPYADGAAPAQLWMNRPVRKFLNEKIPENVIGAEVYQVTRLAYQDEAKRFVHVMLTHMPQGLTDAIFAELASQKASLFMVPQLKE